MNTCELIVPGAYYDMPDAEYRNSGGVSNSMLKLLRERWSPAYVKARLSKPKEATDALVFGKCFDAALLTPELPPCWVITPKDAPKMPTKKQSEAKKPSPETVAAVDWWKKFAADNEGKEVLSWDEGIRLEGCLKAVWGHPAAREALTEGRKQVSVFAPYNFGGSVMRKGRMDCVTPGRAIVDVKTAGDCSPGCSGKKDEFAEQVCKFDYDMQAAYYLDLWNDASPNDRRDVFVFVVVDWEEELGLAGVRVLQCPDELIRSGREKYMEALTKWIECERSGQWPHYSQGMEMLTLPNWRAKKFRTL